MARHFREAEGLSIVQIAQRLGRSPATIKAYFYDLTGEKARAVKARYVGVCRGCGACTQPRNGKGDAYAYCKACHPGAIAQRWTPEAELEAMRDWERQFGWLPTSYDWSATHARTRGGEALERLRVRRWPPAASAWSAPITLPAAVGSGSFAENAPSAQIAVTGAGPQVSSSTTGQTWSAPVTIAAGGTDAAVRLSEIS